MISGTLAQVSTLLRTVACHTGPFHRVTYLAAVAGAAFHGGKQGGGLAADERARSLAI